MSYPGWIYILGERTGRDLKIGYTGGQTPWPRITGVNGEQMDDSFYVPLAAFRGTSTQEAEIKDYFARWRADKGRRREYFRCVPELEEYVNWLRQQWWMTLSRDELVDEPAEWTLTRPTPDRRVARPELDPDRLIQVTGTFHGDLAGTVWDWLSTPEPIGEDFYTPAELVNAARQAMGDIDLDPASHWRANREHRIPTYYNIHRSAFRYPWSGRVWLNPPYGDNLPWFQRILECADEIEQLCFLSPAWVFTAQQARPYMERTSAAVLLSPTPTFWGHPGGRTGTNHPHLITYVGERAEAFIDAFRPYGIPVLIPVEQMTRLAA